MAVEVKRVLFACVHNSGRSQMAEAFARYFSIGKVEPESAGIIPENEVNPFVVEVMKEKGIDISTNTPKLLTQDMVERASIIITMGCSIEEACPVLQIPHEDWEIDDPQGKSIGEIRYIRDQIEERIQRLVTDR